MNDTGTTTALAPTTIEPGPSTTPLADSFAWGDGIDDPAVLDEFVAALESDLDLW